jgi:hypothetical protein
MRVAFELNIYMLHILKEIIYVITGVQSAGSGHSFYLRNFLRKSCATCREKWRRAATSTEKYNKTAQ